MVRLSRAALHLHEQFLSSEWAIAFFFLVLFCQVLEVTNSRSARVQGYLRNGLCVSVPSGRRLSLLLIFWCCWDVCVCVFERQCSCAPWGLNLSPGYSVHLGIPVNNSCKRTHTGLH